MKRRLRLALAGASIIGLGLATGLYTTAASGASSPMLDPANGHATMANGKALAHPSGGSEVTFDDERALAADAQGSADQPPDGTVSALGCANRGSATNPRVNQDCTSRRQAEEQVAVNPFDATNVVAGQNDSRIGFNKCGFDYSLDGGAHFGDGLPPFFQHLSLLGHTYDAASDPALTFDGTGRSWFSCVLFDINTNASGLAVVPSTPALKGSAYANVAAGASPYVVAEDASGAHFFDKEFIAGDHRPGNTSVYVTFTDFQSNPNCKKSFNKGGLCSSPIYLSKWTGSGWTTPIPISGSAPFCVNGNLFNPQLPANACNQDQGSMPVVLPNGDVYVVFSNFNTTSLVNQQLGVLVHVSGNTLTPTPPVRVGLDDETNESLCDFGRGPEECVQALNVRTNDFPAIALDPTDAAHLVATWTDSRAATVVGNHDVIVSESHDGGATWSDANGGGTVLTTPGAYAMPSVAVSAPSGRVVVSMYRANQAHTDPAGAGTYGYGYVVKAGGGAFGPYTPASDGQAYPSPQANRVQAGFLGDYSSVAAAPSGDVVHMVWADTRNVSSVVGPDEDVFMFTTVP